MSEKPSIPDTNTQSEQTNDKALPKEQVRHARFLLLQIQWLVIVLLIGAIAWLRQNQIQLIDQVENRLAVTETFTQRLNSIDDKIFALTPTESRGNASKQEATNDLKLVQAQLAAANRLYESGDYLGASEILASLRYQISAGKLTMAAPLTGLLSQSLTKDIERLDALKNQPDVWQEHIVYLKRIQSYLRAVSNQDKNTVTRTELIVRDTDMLLSLSINAAHIHHKDMMTGYLQDVLSNLEKLQDYTLSDSGKDANDKNAQATNTQDTDTISSLSGAIQATNKLLANPPKLAPLTTIQVLKVNTQN